MLIRLLLAVFLVSMVCGCGLFPEAITVPGPESHTLLPSATGFIVMSPPLGGIVAFELPTLREITVIPASPDNAEDPPTIHMLGGPDDKGRIAYIEDHFFVNDKNRRHLLKTIHLDGTDQTTLFTRPGDAMWATHGEIGRTMALAPTGGRVAFLTGLKGDQMPSALLFEGSIEIWNIDQKLREKTDLQAVDEGLSWFPDGKRLAYVKMIDRASNQQLIDPADPMAESYIQWDRIPAIFIRDVGTDTETFLHVGWHPNVSVDGSKVLIFGFGGSAYCDEVATGRTYPLTGPGKDGPIAMLDDNTLLASCYPTAGTKVKFEGAWPVNGPGEIWAIKLTRIDSWDFQTVIPYVAGGMDISFGQIAKPPGR
jgi:hypothetical protein